MRKIWHFLFGKYIDKAKHEKACFDAFMKCQNYFDELMGLRDHYKSMSSREIKLAIDRLTFVEKMSKETFAAYREKDLDRLNKVLEAYDNRLQYETMEKLASNLD